MSELSNKIVIITGAAGSLGSTTAGRFAREGATVVLVDINRERLEEVQKSLPDGVASSIIETNLLEQSSVDAMAEAVVAEYGTIDMIANIAGGFTMGPLVHETGDKEWDFMMDLNLRSIFHTSRAVIPVMLKNGGGRVVNISARAAREGKAKMGAYCASKAAVITLTESLAAEHKFDNINVNCILPGTIDTPLNRKEMPDADHSKWVPTEALADVILFLCSDASRCVTGAAIPVFGQS
ncbi:MAG: SDR family NAD(P)-dependent oxidoreductase [Gammaproteobacteria bacterium]|jgi:NAD(P)-dependent dehydrogenase (short-subunit alcohol dehydrogenase family)